MSTPQRLVAIAVGAIALLIVAVLVLRASGAPIGLGPSASASPSPTTSGSPSPTAEPTDKPSPTASAAASPESAELDLELLARIEQQVEDIRGLPPADIGQPEILTRDQLREELLELFEADYPAEEREADNVALRAMGLLEPDEDIAEQQLELLGEGVLGFYNDVDKRLVVVSDAGLDAEAKLTYAHEYTHALQDANFPGSLAHAPDEDDDVALARTSMYEGDAQNTMILWAIEHLSPEELVELAETPLPDTSGVPGWLVDITLFPYSDGFAWAQQITGAGTDFAELDEAFVDPPESTEQILHQDKWREREAPTILDDPDVAGTLGTGWEEVESTTIGEAFLRITLTFHGEDLDDAAAAADGWGGDRMVVASGPDEAFGLGWRLAWDGAAEADEFAAAYERVSDELDFPVRLVALSETEHLVVHASSAEILEALVAGLS